MAQLLFDAVSATRRLKDAGFAAKQAEAVVQTVTQANSLTLQMVQDLADLKAHVTENMVTKAYLAETLSQYDLKNMATKGDLLALVNKMEFDKAIKGLVTEAEFEKEFARLYRNLLFGSLGCVTLIIAAIRFL